jgi:glycogen synthase
MRVLMTTDSVGGVWTYALELTDALVERGVEVTLATMGAPLTGHQRAELLRRPALEVHVSTFALEWMDEPWGDVERAGEWLLEIADVVEPDIVHLNQFAFGMLPWPAPVLLVGHSDVVSWHRAVHGVAPGRKYDRYRRAVAEGIAAADVLVAPTRALLDELDLVYEPPCPCAVIPNGCAPRIHVVPKRDLVVTVGRVWDEGKNVSALVDVAPRLPWPVIVAGEGTVGPGVRALGAIGRGDVLELLAGASVFAEPARYEPFGLAALEAGHARCALVLGDIPSLREVWGDAALFVPPDDRAALERALTALIRNPQLLATQAKRAFQRAAGYSIDRMAVQYVEWYARLLTRSEVGVR